MRTDYPLPVWHLDGGRAVVALPDEIDLATASAVADRLSALLSKGDAAVVDMTGTYFCDVSGVEAVVHACHEVQECGTQVGLAIPHPHVRRVFEVFAGWVDQPIRIHHTVHDALPASRTATYPVEPTALRVTSPAAQGETRRSSIFPSRTRASKHGCG